MSGMKPLLGENSCLLFTWKVVTSRQWSAASSDWFISYWLLTMLLWATELHYFLTVINFSTNIKQIWNNCFFYFTQLSCLWSTNSSIDRSTQIKNKDIVSLSIEKFKLYPNSKPDLMDEAYRVKRTYLR